MSVVEQLEALGESVKGQLPWVNHGGCAVYAAAVARRLLENGINSCGIVAGDLGSVHIDLDDLRTRMHPKNMEEWINNGVFFAHVMVRFDLDGKTYTHWSDVTTSEPVRYYKSYPVMKGRMEVDEIEVIASEGYMWNKLFDRRAGIPIIKSSVDALLPLLRGRVNEQHELPFP